MGVVVHHNHNAELQKVTPDKTAYDIIIEETNPEYVNFEFDSYWLTDEGTNVPAIMENSEQDLSYGTSTTAGAGRPAHI